MYFLDVFVDKLDNILVVSGDKNEKAIVWSFKSEQPEENKE